MRTRTHTQTDQIKADQSNAGCIASIRSSFNSTKGMWWCVGTQKQYGAVTHSSGHLTSDLIVRWPKHTTAAARSASAITGTGVKPSSRRASRREPWGALGFGVDRSKVGGGKHEAGNSRSSAGKRGKPGPYCPAQICHVDSNARK